MSTDVLDYVAVPVSLIRKSRRGRQVRTYERMGYCPVDHDCGVMCLRRSGEAV